MLPSSCDHMNGFQDFISKLSSVGIVDIGNELQCHSTSCTYCTIDRGLRRAVVFSEFSHAGRLTHDFLFTGSSRCKIEAVADQLMCLCELVN